MTNCPSVSSCYLGATKNSFLRFAKSRDCSIGADIRQFEILTVSLRVLKSRGPGRVDAARVGAENEEGGHVGGGQQRRAKHTTKPPAFRADYIGVCGPECPREPMTGLVFGVKPGTMSSMRAPGVSRRLVARTWPP